MNEQTQIPIAAQWPPADAGLQAFRDDCHRRAAELREQAMDEAFAAAGAATRKVWRRAALWVRADRAQRESAPGGGVLGW